MGTDGSGVPAAGSALAADIEPPAAIAVPEGDSAPLLGVMPAGTVLVEGNPDPTKPAVAAGPSADETSIGALGASEVVELLLTSPPLEFAGLITGAALRGSGKFAGPFTATLYVTFSPASSFTLIAHSPAEAPRNSN